jgi:hypothetical protein
VRKSEAKTLAKEIQTWLPQDVEVCEFTDSYQALQDIRQYNNPCIVYIQFSKIAINGKNFIEMTEDLSLYIHIFVICEGELSHTNDIQSCIYGTPCLLGTSCVIDIVNKKNNQNIGRGLQAQEAINRTNVVCHIVDIKNKLNKIEEKTKSWQTSLTINS